MDKKTGSKFIKKCADCGSELIFIEETSMTIGNSFSPIIKTRYRCTNDSCQEESDKRESKRKELKMQQELSRLNRLHHHRSILIKSPKTQ